MPSQTFTNSDDFMSGLQGLFDVLSKHSKALIAFGVVVALTGGGMAFVANRRAEKSDAGRNALYEADKALDAALLSIAKTQMPATPVNVEKGKVAPKPAQPDVDALMFQKLDVDTQLSDAVSKLKTVATLYADTRPGMEAMLTLGKLYLNHGASAEAEPWFRQAATHATTPLDRAVAWSSAADALEDQNKLQDALNAVDQAIGAGESSIMGDLLLDKARIYEALHQTAQAKGIYQQIQTQFPNTSYAQTAGLYDSRL